MEIFSQAVQIDLSKQIILQVNEAVTTALSQVGSLHSKDWWKTSELLQRGWNREQLNRLAESGILVREQRDGSAGFVYSAESLIQYIKSIN